MYACLGSSATPKISEEVEVYSEVVFGIMGKKVMKETPLEIPHNNDKSKLNSLIKVLKPKVYITDSASFKKLVQELTGNETSPVAPPLLLPPPAAEKFPAIAVGEDVLVEVDNSMENSGCSSSDLCNLQASFMGESRQVEVSSEEAFFPDMVGYQPALDNFPGNQDADMVGFEEMDSWILEIDPFSVWSNTYGQSFEEAACIYDYDLAGVI